MGILVSEISTPLVNLRALLVIHKKEGTLAFKLNDGIAAVLFLVFRIILYPALGYRLVKGFELLVIMVENS